MYSEDKWTGFSATGTHAEFRRQSKEGETDEQTAERLKKERLKKDAEEAGRRLERTERERLKRQKREQEGEEKSQKLVQALSCGRRHPSRKRQAVAPYSPDPERWDGHAEHASSLDKRRALERSGDPSSRESRVSQLACATTATSGRGSTPRMQQTRGDEGAPEATGLELARGVRLKYRVKGKEYAGVVVRATKSPGWFTVRFSQPLLHARTRTHTHRVNLSASGEGTSAAGEETWWWRTHESAFEASCAEEDNAEAEGAVDDDADDSEQDDDYDGKAEAGERAEEGEGAEELPFKEVPFKAATGRVNIAHPEYSELALTIILKEPHKTDALTFVNADWEERLAPRDGVCPVEQARHRSTRFSQVHDRPTQVKLTRSVTCGGWCRRYSVHPARWGLRWHLQTTRPPRRCNNGGERFGECRLLSVARTAQ